MLVTAFADRRVEWHPRREVCELDPSRNVAILRDGGEMAYDLFLGVPVHRAPAVVVESGMTADGWIPVDPSTLETSFPGRGICYLEFGGDEVALVDVTFFGDQRTGELRGPSRALAADKAESGTSRIQRWFGRGWAATS